MANFSGLVVLTVLAFIHLFVFWRVYKIPMNEDSVIAAAIWRGTFAGAVTNFFVSLLFEYLYGGYSGFLIIYGLPFSIPIGIFVTFLFLSILRKLEITAKCWIRAFLGALIGALIGIITGVYFDSKNHTASNNAIDSMFIFSTAMGLTSAIMAGEKE